MKKGSCYFVCFIFGILLNTYALFSQATIEISLLKPFGGQKTIDWDNLGFKIKWQADSKENCKALYEKVTYFKNDQGPLLLKNAIQFVESTVEEEGNLFVFTSSLDKNTLSLTDDNKILKLYFEYKDGKKDTIIFNFSDISEAQPQPGTGTKNQFITTEMITRLSNGNCSNCNLLAAIPDKKHAIFNTDYFVTYDPMKGVSGDVYTICKHLYEKKKKVPTGSTPYKDLLNIDSSNYKLIERYRKVRPMWFAPKVGSSITFEVQNVPLSSEFQLSVNEKDLFNEGAGQFATIIENLVGKQIVGPLSKTDTSKEKEQSREDNEKTQKQTISYFNNLASELKSYLNSFNISSCAINAHKQNLREILVNINKFFSTEIIGTSDMESKLISVVEKNITDASEKSIALELVKSIAAGFNSLSNVKPIVYSTMRAKNMDFIEIKYKEGNNPESKPEHIRMSGGMKIDFSAGFVLTGMRNYNYILKDIVYNYDPDDSTLSGSGSNGTLTRRDTTGNVITQQDNGKQEVGVAILSHFYPRISSNYNLGGAVGLMTSTDLNLRLMLGGSFIVSSLFGSNNRISFTYGIVWGKVKRLGVESQEFLDKPRIVNNIPQFYSQSASPTPNDKGISSWFFSVNFNFGGK